jgi:hypothetical protein
MCGCSLGAGHICVDHMKVLRDFVQAAEDFAGSDPDMPSHGDTVKEFDRLLGEAKSLVGVE